MVNRTTELKQLETLYNIDKSQIVLVYGARGCLKEELLKKFCEDKKFLYYRGRNSSPENQLKCFINEAKDKFNDNNVSSYNDCFNIACNGNEKSVIVVDDFEYIVKKDSNFVKELVEFKNKTRNVFIILGASSLTWVGSELDNAFLAYPKAIDARIKLVDVGFLDVVRAFPEFSVEESVTVYGILGGVPSYLNRWNQSKTFKENVCENILYQYGYLFSEAEDFIGSELRELTVYDTILASIASGNEKLNDLYNDTGYSRAKISVYMKNLAAFDVISKVVSFETGGWDNAKKGIYRINNNYINFWFHFIYPNLSDLYILSPEMFYDKYIKDQLGDYLQRYFVNVCKEYLELLNKVGQTPIKIEKMGTWLGKNGTIDIIGQDSARNNVVGICNWKNEMLTKADYEKLLDSMKQARISANTIYMFSAKSFDKELVELSKTNPQIVLVDMKEL